jgi:hypothetical protein
MIRIYYTQYLKRQVDKVSIQFYYLGTLDTK